MLTARFSPIGAFAERCVVSTIGSAVKANQVFLPVLENSSKAQRLRTTLSVFERSKFLFSLPGSLAEYIEAVSLENCFIDRLIVVTEFFSFFTPGQI